MASRKELKEQRRREREAAERAALQAQRRRRRLRAAIAALAVVAVGGAGIALAVSGSGDEGESFAAEPDGLQERVQAAGLQFGDDHFHPTVKVFAGEREIPVPDDIGGAEGARESPLHKHAGDEQLHAEGLVEGAFTLGQFMRVWDVTLSPTQLGPYRAEGARTVRMWVKAPDARRFRESREFGRLELRDGMQVYLAYGTPEQAPIAG